jgi:enoyl-CoA hydratase/carnithine racemase
MRACPQPIICLVHGAAAGGGLAIALAADVIVAGESAVFHPAFIKIGLSAANWAPRRGPPEGGARRLRISKRTFDATLETPGFEAALEIEERGQIQAIRAGARARELAAKG